jgi:hypothetical protein
MILSVRQVSVLGYGMIIAYVWGKVTLIFL